MAHRFSIRHQVAFYETDMAGIVHFSNFFRYMELAEHAFFRSLGFTIFPKGADAAHWPRVHTDCDYRRPLRFEDTLEVELTVKERRAKSIAYSFVFRKLNADPVEEVATGNLVVACVSKDAATGAMKGREIPDEIARLIESAPEGPAQ